MHPMIMAVSESEGIIYLNGTYLGEVRPDAPVFRPVPPFGAVCIEMRPFSSMHLSCACRLALSGGSPVPASLYNAGGVHAVAWPFGITEIRLTPQRIYTSAPVVRTLKGTSRVHRYIQSAGFCCLETEYRGRLSVHPLPEYALEPVLAEGEGVLYASGSLHGGGRYALCLSQSGETLLLSVTGEEIRFLPDGKILVRRPLNDLAGHEIQTLYARSDAAFIKEKEEILPNPSGEFQAVTPAECALCALQSMILNLPGELSSYLSDSFSADDGLKNLINGASGASLLHFTPPDGRSAVAILKTVTPSLTEALPVYYTSGLIDGKWKIFDMKA